MEGIDKYQHSPCIAYNIDIWMLNKSGRKMEEIVNFPFLSPIQYNIILLYFWDVTLGHQRAFRKTKLNILNPLTPNGPYRGRTEPLTSKSFILYIYSTNIGTEYFKHGTYSSFFSLQNAVCYIILTYLVPVLFTFYIFIQQIWVLNILNMVYTLRFFYLFKIQFVS